MDIETKDDTGATPLLYAAWSDKLNTFEFLLQQGADVNVQDRGTFFVLALSRDFAVHLLFLLIFESLMFFCLFFFHLT